SMRELYGDRLCSLLTVPPLPPHCFNFKEAPDHVTLTTVTMASRDLKLSFPI
ncbi:hypothetical protein Bpfe_030336, partial [Biomphalaria pfeifferi]